MSRKLMVESIPALRQPKFTITIKQDVQKRVIPDQQYLILTLRDEKKLVLSSDAYNGILTVGAMFQCVLCNTKTDLDIKYKQLHVNSLEHQKAMETVPYVTHYSEKLVRQLNDMDVYCVICNAVIPVPFLARHIVSENHTHELDKARARVSAYTPQYCSD